MRDVRFANREPGAGWVAELGSLDVVARTMARAAIIGVIVFSVSTLVIQVACWSLSGGENALGLMLFLPWVVVFSPLHFFYLLVGIEWRVGGYGGIESIMLQQAMLLNAILGAVVTAGLWKSWQLGKRFVKRRDDT